MTITDAIFAIFFAAVTVWLGHHIAHALWRAPLEYFL